MHEHDAHYLLFSYAQRYDPFDTRDSFMSLMDMGSVIAEFTPPINATVVQLLTDSGASIVGKTNCDEFGMGYVPRLSI